jgi:hypothetical protein
MGTTIKQLFTEFELDSFNYIKWGNHFTKNEQGVYVVSTSSDPNENLGISDSPLFDDIQINNWINSLPNFLIDNIKANPKMLKNRLSNFWLPDENILYIGKAPTRKGGSGISRRVGEYFNTNITARSPHAGGQWIKSLGHLNDFTVYYAECESPAKIESKMLEFFMANVSHKTLTGLYDKTLPLPFANIKFNKNKFHGLKNHKR